MIFKSIQLLIHESNDLTPYLIYFQTQFRVTSLLADKEISGPIPGSAVGFFSSVAFELGVRAHRHKLAIL